MLPLLLFGLRDRFGSVQPPGGRAIARGSILTLLGPNAAPLAFRASLAFLWLFLSGGPQPQSYQIFL